MKNFSCSYPRLYGSGGFYESSDTARALVDIADECRWTANLYPPYRYDRPMPAQLLSRDADFTAKLSNQFSEWNTTYGHGSSTDLFALRDGLLFNRCLYKAVDGEIIQMYETNTPAERKWRPDLNPAVDLREIQQPRDGDTDFFYLGSIGSENYGHWLVDDLTRAASLLTHFSRERLPTIVLNAYHPIIDSVREQSLRALCYAWGQIEVIFVNYRLAYFFPRLFFVSPSTHHPFLKCPQGIRFLHDHFVDQADRMPQSPGPACNVRSGKQLFVTRRALWRNVINLEAVIAYFTDLAFDIVELEGLSFIDQVRIFSRAHVIVGVMGAGMTNVVFSPPGCTVVHLAPEGWTDPFCWDLAAVRNDRYCVAFGQPWKPEAPSFSGSSGNLVALKWTRKPEIASFRHARSASFQQTARRRASMGD